MLVVVFIATVCASSLLVLVAGEVLFVAGSRVVLEGVGMVIGMDVTPVVYAVVKTFVNIDVVDILDVSDIVVVMEVSAVGRIVKKYVAVIEVKGGTVVSGMVSFEEVMPLISVVVSVLVDGPFVAPLVVDPNATSVIILIVGFSEVEMEEGSLGCDLVMTSEVEAV